MQNSKPLPDEGWHIFPLGISRVARRRLICSGVCMSTAFDVSTFFFDVFKSRFRRDVCYSHHFVIDKLSLNASVAVDACEWMMVRYNLGEWSIIYMNNSVQHTQIYFQSVGRVRHRL